ncbi:MAG: GvpL/GvpF family gas vesicle protein, partial [Pseudomonadota bacterium]
MIYLYGLVEPRGAEIAVVLKDAEGLQGPLQHAEIAGWTLVYSDHDDQEILPKRRLLLAHTKVLERLLTIGTTLPARFGLVARDL